MKKLLLLFGFFLATFLTTNAQCWQNFASGGGHSLALKGDGTLWAWGHNFTSQLGDGTTTDRTSPVQIGTATNWKSISVGGYHSMGIKTDGTLWAWGDNTYGQLGDGTTTNRATPVQIGTATNWLFVNLGVDHSIAIKTDGTLWACGLNSSSQLGDGTSVDKNTFVQIGTATNWQSASGGENFTMAIQTSGTLWGFGNNNFRQLGDGTTTTRTTPVQIGVATNWSTVASGQGHSVAVKTDGTLWSWGFNVEGALGAGAVTQRATPLQIDAATNWKAVGAYYRHSLATKTDGTLWAFGYNDGGQLGDGTTVNKNTPVQIGTGTNSLYADAGFGNSFSIKTDGTIWSSGYGGSVGDGTIVSRTSPVQVMTTCAAASLNFDGADDDVRVIGFPGFTEYTIEGWFNLNSLTDQNLVVGTGNGNPNAWFTNQLHLSGGKFTHYLYDGSVQTISSSIIPSTGVWYHVAIVAKNGTPVRIYVNGTSSVSASNVGSMSGANEYRLGGTASGNLASFNGKMDEVRIWNVARTQCEINTYMNCEIPTTSAGLLANYHFNQGLDATPNPTVTLLTDALGSAFTGTLTNFALTGTTSNWVTPGGVVSGYTTTTITTPTVTVNSGSVTSGSSFTIVPGGGVSYTYLPSGPIVTPSTSSTYTVTGTSATGCTNTAISTVSVQGAALNFDGADDFIQSVSTPNIPSLNAFTIESWVKLNSTTNGKIFSSAEMEFAVTSGQLEFYSPALSGFSTGSIASGSWQHVAATYNGSTLSFYINGVLSGTSTATGMIAANTGYKIGKHVSVNCCLINGSIDELKLWNRALCLTEIQNNKNAELPSGQTGLVLYHKMNQGFALAANSTVTTSIDASGNNNNANLINFGLTGSTSNWIAPGSVVTGSTAAVFNSPISASAATTSVSCGGSATGSATITASGGAPYTYSWTPSVSTASVASGLSAGNYTVLVSGLCGVRTVTLSIAAPSAITVNPVSQTNVACFGGSTGAAQVSASGGTGILTYDWSPGSPTGDLTSSITGLIAGTYSCIVTDANACSKTSYVFTVTQPPNLSGTTVVTNVACFGGSNGAINLTPNGGTSPYTFNWLPSGPTTEDRTGLVAGTYSVQVTDNNGCTSTINATVTQPTNPVSGTTVVTNVSCFGGSNGAINLTPNGGTSPYTFNWLPSGPTTEDRTGLVAGTYTVQVTDFNGCTSTINATVTQPTAITATTTQTNVLCNGGNTGSAFVSASGGMGSFTYSWSPGGGTGSTASGLVAGNYTCTISDANSCAITKTVTITQLSALSLSPFPGRVYCNGGNNGYAQANISGGAGAYTFTWSPSLPAYNATTYSFVSNLTAGGYTVMATDGNGCTISYGFNITQPTPFTVIPAQTNVSCNGGSDGSASVNVSGSNTGYTYNWSSGGNTSSVSGLAAGVYNVDIQDDYSCTTSQSFTISEAPALLATTAQTNVACFGASTGMASVNASGGTGSYTYSWSPNGGNAATAANLSAGSYTSTVTDANGCFVDNAFVITENAAITSVVSVTDCSSYTLNGTTYTLSGTYTQTLANASSMGCDSTITLNLTINQPTSSMLTEVACGSYVLNATTYTAGGTYTQMLTNAAGCDSTLTLNLTINQPTNSTLTEVACSSYVLNGTTYTTSGTYVQMLTNTAGCDSTLTLNLTINQPTSATLTEVACSSYVLNGTAYTTSGTYVQMLTNTAGCDSTLTLNLTINQPTDATITEVACGSYVLNATTYTAGGTYTQMLTNATGCDSTITLNLTINALPAIMAMTSNTLLCTGETATLSATGATSYTWSTSENTADIAVSPTSTVTYTVEGTDGNGCSNSTTITQDVSLCTGIAVVAEALEATLNVYPNPGKGIFYIELTTDSKVSVMNALGQTLINEEMSTGKQELDLRHEADGIYFVKVTRYNKQKVIKIIKGQ